MLVQIPREMANEGRRPRGGSTELHMPTIQRFSNVWFHSGESVSWRPHPFAAVEGRTRSKRMNFARKEMNEMNDSEWDARNGFDLSQIQTPKDSWPHNLCLTKWVLWWVTCGSSFRSHFPVFPVPNSRARSRWTDMIWLLYNYIYNTIYILYIYNNSHA